MKIKIRDIPLVLLVLWLLVWNFGITEFQNYYPVNLLAWFVRTLALFYFILVLVYSSGIKKANIFIYTGIMVFLLYICVKTENTRYFDTIFFVISLRKTDYKRILRVGSLAQFVIIMITIISSLIGLIPNEQVYNAGRIRYNLGFIYCSYSANMLFFAIAGLISSFDNKRKLKIHEVIVLSALNYLVFHYTNTKASFWGTFLLIILAFFAPESSFNDRFMRLKMALVASFIPIASLASVLIGLFYDASNSIHAFLNVISSGRIYMAYVGLKTYGIHLLGSDFQWATDHTTEYFYVDSSYVNILLTMGLITLVLICCGFARLGASSVRLGDRKLALVLFFVAIHCLTDPQLLDLRYNLFVVICLNAFLPRDYKIARTVLSENSYVF